MYVLDRDRQISLIREMTQLRKDNENWEVYYHHPSTNAMWKSYFPRANGKRRGPKILRTEPVPEHLKRRLDTCLIDAVPENAMGLGIELSVTPEHWEAVVQLLETNYRRYNRSQLSLFIQHLSIDDYDGIAQCSPKCSLSKEKITDLGRRAKIVRFKRFWFL